MFRACDRKHEGNGPTEKNTMHKVLTAAGLGLFNGTDIIYHERSDKFIFVFFQRTALCLLMHVR